MIKEEFGNILKPLIEKSGKSKTEISLESGVSLRFIQEMENGDKQPSITTVFYLAAALDMTPDKLILPAWEKWLEAGQPDEKESEEKEPEEKDSKEKEPKD